MLGWAPMPKFLLQVHFNAFYHKTIVLTTFSNLFGGCPFGSSNLFIWVKSYQRHFNFLGNVYTTAIIAGGWNFELIVSGTVQYGTLSCLASKMILFDIKTHNKILFGDQMVQLMVSCIRNLL